MISIIIRTLNEEKYLPECIQAIKNQIVDDEFEIILVDSGSTDHTLEIANREGVYIEHIPKNEFTFGRSLNFGCMASKGEILVFISAHCIPVGKNWLRELVSPIKSGSASYTYGKQIGRRGVSKYSEMRVFEKYFSNVSAIPQEGYFCNNANSAMSRECWEALKFNEDLTGLEDLEFAKRLNSLGEFVGYVAESAVEHIHEETWPQIRRRFEREAAALATFEPTLSISFGRMVSLTLKAITHDIFKSDGITFRCFVEILKYRSNQFYGSYKGSTASTQYLNAMRHEYFYPTTENRNIIISEGSKYEYRSPTPNESA